MSTPRQHAAGANRIGSYADDAMAWVKQKGEEALDDGTSRLVQDAKDKVTAEYGEAAGAIVGSALESVQEEYFAVEGKPITPEQMSFILKAVKPPQVAQLYTQGKLSPQMASALLRNRVVLPKHLG